VLLAPGSAREFIKTRFPGAAYPAAATPPEGARGAMTTPTSPAIVELLRIVEPPLRYLATARPKRLAANALPTARILELIDRAAAERGGDRSALDKLRALFNDFPLDADEARQRSAAAGLQELDRLKQGSSSPKGRSPQRSASCPPPRSF
jgi:hypothetical protein